MPHVVVLATGGTIASSAQDQAGAVATRNAGELLTRPIAGISVESIDLLQTNSFLLTHGDLRLICEAAAHHLARDEVDGVVLTHGTDTMEETAFLLNLVLAGDKPLVLTGAQLTADEPGSDGPTNLRQAIHVAAAASSRSRGVMISFAGQVFGAHGTRKVHTSAPAPFATAGAGPIGTLIGDTVHYQMTPRRAPTLSLPTHTFDQTRVDVVAVHPSSDATLARAAVSAGARGVLIAGSGIGNGNHEVVQWVHEAAAEGIHVGLSTRVSEGPVRALYGNGGSFDMIAAGAVPFGQLPLYQARLLMAYLISAHIPPTAHTIAPYL